MNKIMMGQLYKDYGEGAPNFCVDMVTTSTKSYFPLWWTIFFGYIMVDYLLMTNSVQGLDCKLIKT